MNEMNSSILNLSRIDFEAVSISGTREGKRDHGPDRREQEDTGHAPREEARHDERRKKRQRCTGRREEIENKSW